MALAGTGQHLKTRELYSTRIVQVHAHVHSGIIRRHQKAEVPRRPRMDARIKKTWCTHTGDILGLKKKDNSYTRYNLGEP